MIEVKKTSIQIPKDMLIKIKAMAVKQGTTQNTIITNLIAKGMEKTKKKGKIKAKIINHKMPFYDPDYKGSLNNMAGIIKLDHETDAVELKNSIYTDKAGF